MAIALYMDHHVPKAITNGLRLRDVEVMTAYEDGTGEFNDQQLLERATKLQRTLFTQDDDLLKEAAKCLREGIEFCGVIYAHQLHAPIGICIRDLEIIAKSSELPDILNQIIFLPL